MKMESQESVEGFIAKIEENAERLKDLDEPVSDNMIMTKILMSLPDVYKHFVTAWESTSDDAKNLANLTNRLILEQTRLNPNHAESSAFTSKNVQHFKRKSKCFLCNKEGHWKKDCPKLKKRTRDRKTEMNHQDEAFIGRFEKFRESKEAWLIDSGASEHMTYHGEWFSKFTKYSIKKHVRIGNGTM